MGFSETKYGSGFGPALRKQVIDDAFDIIKKGSTQPEIFHLVELFEENIGPDRLSDMIATIILQDIVNYTKKILGTLNITPNQYPDLRFKDGLVLNPYKDCEILLLPVDILQALPIARCWDDIDRVIHENENIRREVNEVVSEEWSKWASGTKKQFLKEQIFKDPEKCARVIDGYRESTVPKVTLSCDTDYYVAAIFQKIKKSDISFLVPDSTIKTSLQATHDVINIFKDWVENNRGWSIILETDSIKREKVVQRLIHLGAKNYIMVNNVDISFEPNAGSGPADFKMSRGQDKTVCEIKLSSNTQYLHGYTVQIEEYAQAEMTSMRVFVFIDIGNPIRCKRIIEEHDRQIEMGRNPPDLVIIDSTEKSAASTA